MAVGVSSDPTGSVDRDALIRGPFVITPSVPVLTAPGDEFEAGVTVANNLEGSGPDAEIELRAETTEPLSILQSPVQKLRIAEGREHKATVRFRVPDQPRPADLRVL